MAISPQIEPSFTFSYKATTTISARRIADMLIGAFETPAGSWCLGVTPTIPAGVEVTANTPWYDQPVLISHPDFKMTVLEDEDDSGDRDDAKKHLVGQSDIIEGLQLMADSYPRHFADMVNENDDAETADVLLQLIVLKDVVYG